MASSERDTLNAARGHLRELQDALRRIRDAGPGVEEEHGAFNQVRPATPV